jgi:6-phosphogluconolactonase
MAKTEDFVIGTYTNRTSHGIYRVTFNEDAERLENVRLAVETVKPSFLQVNKLHRVFTIKRGMRGEIGEGGIAIYQLYDDDRPAVLLSTELLSGPTPAYLCLDAKRNLVYAANYHAGRIDVFWHTPDGQLLRVDHVEHTGQTGPRPEQDSPHVHYADLTPDGRLITCDLGLDQIDVYDVSDKGKLSLVTTFHDEPGFGTRHLAFHPSGKYVYVIGELSSQIETLRYDSSTGSLDRLQQISTIMPTWLKHNGASAVRVSPDGRFVYASNRGENTLVVYAVQEDGTLKEVQRISSAGDFPRDFNFSRNGKYIIAGNEHSDTLVLYKRNEETGGLSVLQQDLICPEPICIQRY